MQKVNWPSLEDRLRVILKETNKTKNWKEAVVRIDNAIAAFTGRGNSLELIDSEIEEDEWNRFSKKEDCGAI